MKLEEQSYNENEARAKNKEEYNTQGADHYDQWAASNALM